MKFCEMIARNRYGWGAARVPSSMVLAIPPDFITYDYLNEHHLFSQIDSQAGDCVEELAPEILATTRNVKFGVD